MDEDIVLWLRNAIIYTVSTAIFFISTGVGAKIIYKLVCFGWNLIR